MKDDGALHIGFRHDDPTAHCPNLLTSRHGDRGAKAIALGWAPCLIYCSPEAFLLVAARISAEHSKARSMTLPLESWFRCESTVSSLAECFSGYKAQYVGPVPLTDDATNLWQCGGGRRAF